MNTLRKIRNTLLGLFALLLIATASLVAVLETATGSRWVILGVADLVGLEVGTVKGNLRSGLDISFIEYQLIEPAQAQRYRAEHISFRWRPIALLYGTVAIRSLRAGNIIIQPPLAPEVKDPEPFNAWPYLGLPVRIELDNVRLSNIRYQQGDTALHFERLGGSLTLGKFHLRYRNLAVRHQDYALTLSGATDLDFPYDTQATLAWGFDSTVDIPPALAPVSAATTASAPAFTAVTDPLLIPEPLRTSTPESLHPSTPGLLHGADPLRSADPLGVNKPLPTSVVAPGSSTHWVYQGKAQLDGDMFALRITSDTVSPVVLQASAQLALVDEHRYLKASPTMTLDAQWQAQTLPVAWWVAQQPAPLTSGKLHAEGEVNAYRATLTGDFKIPDAPALDVQAQAQGSLEQIAVEYLRIYEKPAQDAAVQAATKPQGVELNGQVRWAPYLQWQAKVMAQSLNLATLLAEWPSHINARFTTEGSFNASQWQGQVTDLALSGHLRNLRLEGQGSVFLELDSVHTEALHLVWGANQFKLKGAVGEALNVEWSLQAPLLEQLDPSLKGSFVSTGKINGTWQAPQLYIDAKADRLAWQDYSVESLTLSLLPPGATAATTTPIASSASSSASQDPSTKTQTTAAPAPTAKAEAPEPSAPVAEFSSTPARRLSTAALLSQHYRLDFAAKKLRAAEQYFSQIIMKGDGSIRQHEFEAIIKNRNYGNTELGIVGGFDKGTWRGQLTQFGIKIKKVPRWWLTSSQAIQVSAERVDIESVCLTTSSNLTAIVERNVPLTQGKVSAEWQPQQSPVKNPYAWLETATNLPASKIEKLAEPQLCLQGEWTTTSGLQAQARLDSVPLRQFYALFKTEVYFAGVMDGLLQVNAKTFALNAIQADMSVTTRGAELRYQFAGGGTEVYAWRGVNLKAAMDKGKLDSTFAMDWQDHGTISASAQLDIPSQKINKAQVNANFSNLAPLETLLVFANDVKGHLVADLQMGGTFAQPYVLGKIQLQNGSANLPKLGVNLTAIDMLLTSTQAGVMSLVSRAQSDKGNLSVRGDLQQFGSEQWQLQGNISGADFEIVKLPQLKATLTPNIQISASQEAIRLSGDALIPWARTNIKALPESATQVSRDVVIIDDESSTTQKDDGIPIYTNINLALGDDVAFKGFGLDSKLSGKLNILKDSNRQLLTTGYVSVKEGSYTAYGQTLTIERGRLIFQGDYENPGLDIRASRVIEGTETTTVGLAIDGTLQRPNAQVFSRPQKNDSQAMMMLLTGKPVEQASKADALILLSAVGGVGGDSDKKITGDVASFFHLDELEVKSDKGIDQSELWVGKYLTPRLLVRYMVGIFDEAFSVGVRYQLTDGLRLEAESGEFQSVDVVYKIER